MANNRNIFERILFPTYDEVVENYKVAEEKGIEHLKAFGFNIGDTVYMDGKLEAIIYSANYYPYRYQVIVTMSGANAADYLGIEKYHSFTQIRIPCSMSDFTKERIAV